MLTFIKMKKNLQRTIELPQGFQSKLEKNILTISGNNKQVKKEFKLRKIKLESLENKIKIFCENSSRRESKVIGTTWAHINNMIKGLQEPFIYQLEICNNHFPMSVKLEGNKVIIKSLLGEKKERFAKILPNVDVKINANQITVTSDNIESAGQTAANLEKATKITNRDRRIFQDGIYITEKCGRKI